MKVSDVMTTDVLSCKVTDTLSQVAELMMTGGCGFIPVLTGEGELEGVITDRDIAVTAHQEGRRLSEITVKSAMSSQVITSYVDDPISLAEKLMSEHRVRRLPVLDFNGQLVGVVSLDDLAVEAREQVRLTGMMQVGQAGVAETLAEIASTNHYGKKCALKLKNGH